MKLKPTSYVAFSAQPVFNISSTVWMKALDFLVYNNTLQCIPLELAPENFPNDLGRIDSLISHLAPRLQNSLFSENYKKSYETICLLDAALNADLAVVEHILNTSKNPQEMLCVEGVATITHLNIERTGTPLQMALYGHDEEMVAYFKAIMDPEEFDRQSKEAFKKAISPKKCVELESRHAAVLEYHQAMLEQQNSDAEALCAGLEDVFGQTLANEFTTNNNLVASTTSQQLPGIIDAFITRLTEYVTNNSVHNPFILQRVYEIYNRLLSDFNRDCYFSQKVIGGVQSFLSARWLQHYAQGIDYLADNNEAPRRSFICRDSNPHVDVRRLVSSCIGGDSFLSIFGGNAGLGRPIGARADGERQPGRFRYKNYLEQKQQSFRTYCTTSAIDLLRNSMK